jgi:tetratricopeptide (TPR) repeat protein
MSIPEAQVAALVRSSKRAAVLSALGALVVFSALGAGSLKLLQTNGDLDQQIAKKQALQAKLDQDNEEKRALQAKLDQEIEASRKVTTELARANQEKAAARAETEDLTDRVAAAAPDSFMELPTEVQKQVAPPAAASASPRERARAEWRAGFALRSKDPVAATKHFEAAIEADKNYAAPYNSLGRLAFDRHELDRATAYYREALKRSSTYAPALYNLAITSEKRGNHLEAQRYASELRRQRPEDAKARKLVESLQGSGSKDMVPLP